MAVPVVLNHRGLLERGITEECRVVSCEDVGVVDGTAIVRCVLAMPDGTEHVVAIPAVAVTAAGRRHPTRQPADPAVAA